MPRANDNEHAISGTELLRPHRV